MPGASKQRMLYRHLPGRITLVAAMTAALLTGSSKRIDTTEGKLLAALAAGNEQMLVEAIKTHGGIDALVQLCDESPASTDPSAEVAITNLLQMVQPRSREDRDAIRQAALSVLRTTEDRQIALGLTDLLLRQTLEEQREQPGGEHQALAKVLLADILRGAVHPGIITRAAIEVAVFRIDEASPAQTRLLTAFCDLSTEAGNYGLETVSVVRDQTAPAPPVRSEPVKSSSISSARFLIFLIGTGAVLVVFIALPLMMRIAGRPIGGQAGRRHRVPEYNRTG